MATDPRITHALDQLSGLTGDVSRAVATYKRQLIDEGMSEAEAWALAQKLEERLLGDAFDAAEEIVKKRTGGEEC